MTATTDQRLVGARGVHNADVVVRKVTAGIEQLWVIECKKWNRRVSKLHVAALAEIVKDVGADRGILLSESGFQAGAIRMARSSNITLSSIADLKDNSEDERAQIGLIELRKRFSGFRHEIDTLNLIKTFAKLPKEQLSHLMQIMPGIDFQKVASLRELAGIIEYRLVAAETGRRPFAYIFPENDTELLAELRGALADLEAGLIEVSAATRALREGIDDL
jgi:hypothetical protein